LYKEASAKAIEFVIENLGSFPSKEIRIYEIPYYQSLFYSFPNGIAISEKEGWYAKTDALNERAYIYQTVSSQIIKQWIQSNISLANVQGADMLKVALPEALALSFVEKELGKEALEIMLKKKSDKYAKDKNNEANQEPTLLYADGADYLEQYKGAIVMCEVIKEIGTDNFCKYLIDWSTKDGRNSTFKDFIDYLSPKLKIETYNKFKAR